MVIDLGPEVRHADGPDGLQAMTQQVADHFAATIRRQPAGLADAAAVLRAVRSSASAMSGLRIGLVCPYSFDRPGGVQNHVLGLAEALRGLGHHPAVLGPG